MERAFDQTRAIFAQGGRRVAVIVTEGIKEINVHPFSYIRAHLSSRDASVSHARRCNAEFHITPTKYASPLLLSCGMVLIQFAMRWV